MKKILVIVGKSINRNELEQFLAGVGYTVGIAIDGEIGLEKVNNMNPDCIITSIDVPKINGLELIMTVRNRMMDIPIIAICRRERFGHCDYYEPAKQFGANEVLIKPFKNVELVSSLRRWVA